MTHYEVVNRRLDHRARFLNSIAVRITMIGLITPFLIPFGRAFLPPANWLTIGAFYILLGVGLHCLAHLTLKGLR
ncbi:hypothetical protein [Jiella mangrovi]|uniref:DUF2892 domain-containing protein n=1 Tax=Jiella mangrovi TaxID=2821407 RepID=A0ABS4BM96_9HYPH|nr:hypothetical protein [Jiella mangrovi]MBP0617800.1 hypothetical protein [Jiella mangrovi]